MQLNPYLNFNGKCEEAFKAYGKSLKGNIEFLMRNGESPMADQTPSDQKNNVLHATLRFGDQVIMGADAPPKYYEKPQGFSISITVKDIQEAERIFNELSVGGSVRMPLQKTFWAERFGMFTDRYDIPWMINCE
jgi:PhnB protein